jgi:hypothetical protein
MSTADCPDERVRRSGKTQGRSDLDSIERLYHLNQKMIQTKTLSKLDASQRRTAGVCPSYEWLELPAIGTHIPPDAWKSEHVGNRGNDCICQCRGSLGRLLLSLARDSTDNVKQLTVLGSEEYAASYCGQRPIMAVTVSPLHLSRAGFKAHQNLVTCSGGSSFSSCSRLTELVSTLVVRSARYCSPFTSSLLRSQFSRSVRFDQSLDPTPQRSSLFATVLAQVSSPD